MANEITTSSTLSVANGSVARSRAKTLSVDQTAARANHIVVAVGTSEESLTFTDITTPRWIRFENLDATNFVDIGPDSTGIVNFISLKPGEHAVLPLAASVTIKAKADTAEVDLDVLVLDD